MQLPNGYHQSNRANFSIELGGSMKLFNWRKIALLPAAGILALSANVSCLAEESLTDVMKRRGLTEKDILAAAETYVPTGKRDEFIVFSSGGQSGHVIVYGIPSMRILKYIAVFTPEPWQGYGFDDESKVVLAQGKIMGKDITYGDTHHPALSETKGEYDGRYLFINDKANPRIAVIDLHDFETKQIVVNPVFKSSHGGAFVTENTEYVIEAAQYPAPFENEYVPLAQFNDRYRGGMTYWKFNDERGRIEPENSFTIMAPPYSQDLSDFGKGPSSGWSFTNSFCSERYVGGIMQGKPPFEAGCSAKDTDFLHVVNWKKAAQVVKAGKVKEINGHNVITIETAVKEGLLYLIPEPKSPHGADVSPDGQYIIVSGKLDTHTSVYSFAKIQQAIADKNFEGKDDYGIPIIAMKDALYHQVQLGLGPLHTQYDSKKCVAYTSLYVDSMVAKWDYCKGKVLDKISIHYNIGHLMTMQGDSRKPEGKYLVSLNKLAIDRFNPVGPLHPQNHQLIDISGDKMELLYDMPLPLGEPHYAVAIKAETLKPINRYNRGTNPRGENTAEKTPPLSPYRARAGKERIVETRDEPGKPGKVEVFGTTIRSHITPEIIEVIEGDEVVIHLTNLERAEDQTHGFAIYGQNVNLSLEPGKTASYSFKADKAGVFPYYCTEFCSALHLEMEGYLLVRPVDYKEIEPPPAPSAPHPQEAYNKQVKENVATQAVIDQVVSYIFGVNYKDFPPVVALVEDAVDQLNFAKATKEKSEKSAQKEDWHNATLWAIQWWQYQVKAANIGLRAKAYLEQHGAVSTIKTTPDETAAKADYDKLAKDNLAQQAAIHKEVVSVLSRKYYNFPETTALVNDLLSQLNAAKKTENNAKSAADKENWQEAVTAAKKWQQSQSKAANAVSKAKASLEKQEAVVVEPSKGAALYKSKTCHACHGANADTPIMPIYPKLAGQNKEYAITQLKDIKSGARNHGMTMLMKGIMATVNDAEMEKIATWLASLPTKIGTVTDSALADKGAILYKERTCLACHGKDAQTPMLSNYPKLGGQNPQYAIAQMKDIKSAARNNGQTAAMKGVMHLVSDAEMEAIVQWLVSPVEPKKKKKIIKPLLPSVVESSTCNPENLAEPDNWVMAKETEEALSLEPDLDDGRDVYEVCAACHLDSGWGEKSGTFPQLAGQHRSVLIKQLADIRARNRDNPTMRPFTNYREIGGPQSVSNVTGYIEQKLLMNPGNGLGAGDDLVHGKQLYKDNCVKCHCEKGEGNAKRYYPRIQGQHYEYMLRQFEWIRDGKRRNANSDMVKQIKDFTDRDMKAVIDYISRIKPHKGLMAPNKDWEPVVD
jgi:nitrous-oxide reductase